MCEGMGRGTMDEEGCAMSYGVLLVMEVEVSAVEMEKSSAARWMLKVRGDTWADGRA